MHEGSLAVPDQSRAEIAGDDGAAGEPISLSGVVLPDSRTGAQVDLGSGPPLAVLSLIRHRY